MTCGGRKRMHMHTSV